ncbi:hypothetical protein LZ554_007493 [Drepanopeziza brunnea f. sp. 'monogermtubi']|nr:hypothetical protein LZ554_007493 [Drepanopeziza brunnea f. sp. 'monogermtubi']
MGLPYSASMAKEGEVGDESTLMDRESSREQPRSKSTRVRKKKGRATPDKTMLELSTRRKEVNLTMSIHRMNPTTTPGRRPSPPLSTAKPTGRV